MRAIIIFLGAIICMLPKATSATTSEKKPRIGVGCLVQNKGKILLGQRKGSHGIGSWAPPGGHLEFGESIEECALRELFEETGLQAQSFHLGPWVENVMENGEKHYITVFVLIDNFVGEPTLLEPEKCEGWEWFSWDNLPQPLFLPMSSMMTKEPSLFYQKVSDAGLSQASSGSNTPQRDLYTENLFSYGTLRYENVQLTTFGRLLAGQEDSLPGYFLKKVKITDPEVIAKSGEDVHSIIYYSGNSQDQIPGMVFKLSKEELEQADKYEVADYKRVEVKLLSGISAWVYVSTNSS